MPSGKVAHIASALSNAQDAASYAAAHVMSALAHCPDCTCQSMSAAAGHVHAALLTRSHKTFSTLTSDLHQKVNECGRAVKDDIYAWGLQA